MDKQIDYRKMTRDSVKKLFILEDEANICELLRQSLEVDYDLVFERDGRKALSRIQVEKPDLVMLDIRVPNQSGIEVLKLLKLHTLTRDMPVLMLTALADKPTVLNCLRLGAADYLVKPFDIPALKAKIETLLSTPPHPSE